MLKTLIVLAASLLASHALAADPAAGRLLAASHCAVCHAVAPPERNEVVVAPPFAVIARTYGSSEAPWSRPSSHLTRA